MKIYNISDVNKFCNVIDQCKGKVSLITSNGDKLNLKSKLSQYVSLAKYFGSNNIPEIEVLADEPRDVARLAHFMIGA